MTPAPKYANQNAYLGTAQLYLITTDNYIRVNNVLFIDYGCGVMYKHVNTL